MGGSLDAGRGATYNRHIRLAVTSDLHVDHHPEVIPLLHEAIVCLKADVLVVAGDLTAHDDVLEQSLAGLRSAAREAVFVPGNHDLWCCAEGPTSRDRYEHLVPQRARSAGFHALGHGEPPRLFGHRFVGVTGWFDYSLRNRALDETFTREHYTSGRYGMLQWSDKFLVRWPGDDGGLLDDPGICAQQVASLEAQLAACGEEPVVVVTHHLGFHELVTCKGILPWDFLNGFMGSERLGEAMRQAPNVRLAIAGHTHFQKDVVLDVRGRSLRALTSPLGYPREYKREGHSLPERVRRRVTLVELSD